MISPILTSLALASTLTSQDLLIRDAIIVSPNVAISETPLDVRVENGRITAIGEDLDAQVSETELNAAGLYLTPGLIDSHVHLGGNGGLRGDMVEENIELVRAYRQQEPRSYLYWGFTTLLDLTRFQPFVDRWNGLDLSPQLHACRAAPYANGYGMMFEPEEYRYEAPYYIHDPDVAESIPAGHDPAEHTPEAVVERIAGDGDAICIKTFHEPGFGGLFDFNTAPTEVLDRVAREAETRGLFNLLHATSLLSWHTAVEARVHVMAHGLWHWDQLNGAPVNPETELPPQIEDLLDATIENDITVQLTTGVIHGEVSLYDADFLTSDALAATLPPELITWHSGPYGGWFRENLERMVDDNPVVVENFLGHAPTGDPGETSRAALRRVIAVGRYLHTNGAELVLASDTPSSPTYTNAPGLHGYQEMLTMAQMEMAPLEVLAAATINNARLLGLEDEIGSVEVGKQADLLLLSEDPRDNITAMGSIRWVIVDGRPVQREYLSASN